MNIDTWNPKAVLSIWNRKSIRAFSETPISEKDLTLLFSAASRAPSSNNEQPWEYLYAHACDRENFAAISDCLLAGNQIWAKNAPLLILSMARIQFQANGRENTYRAYDVGAANLALLLQAQEIGIYGHIMAGFDKQKAHEIIGNPIEREVVVIIALGYPGDSDQLPEPYKSRENLPRTRKTPSEFARPLNAESTSS